MTFDAVASAVGAHGLPESVLALSSLAGVDYADHFTLRTDAGATPEGWARAMFGDVPNVAELLIWRVVLGLRLRGGPSPDTVAGWRICGHGEDWVRLETGSWLLAANLVVQATGDRVALATFIRYEHRLAQFVWPPLSAIHRQLVPGALRNAVKRVSHSGRIARSATGGER